MMIRHFKILSPKIVALMLAQNLDPCSRLRFENGKTERRSSRLYPHEIAL